MLRDSAQPHRQILQSKTLSQVYVSSGPLFPIGLFRLNADFGPLYYRGHYVQAHCSRRPILSGQLCQPNCVHMPTLSSTVCPPAHKYDDHLIVSTATLRLAYRVRSPIHCVPICFDVFN